jgi:Domain of unknown function (DUF4920)
MKKILIPIFFLAVAAIACNKTASTAATTNAKKEVSESEAFDNFKKQANDGKHFGATITAKNAMKYDDMFAKLQQKGGLVDVKVEGKVDAVCKAKGCWMNVVSDKDNPAMFVKFKDYAFFMPKDLAGKRVVMQGNAYKEVTSVEELKHLAEDAGKSKEDIAKITKPKEEYKFMASGVVILD